MNSQDLKATLEKLHQNVKSWQIQITENTDDKCAFNTDNNCVFNTDNDSKQF